jgi:Flp pilus assembly protein TadD
MQNDGLLPFINQIETLKSEGNYQAAKSIVDALLIKHTDDYRLYEELCDIYLFMGDHPRASEAIAVARTLNPESATGMYLLGYLSITHGNFDLGIELLERANELFPNNPEILRNLGWWLTVTGKGERGIFLLRRALNMSPDDLLIMEDLAVALISDGACLDEAEELLKKAGKESRIRELKSLMQI